MTQLFEVVEKLTPSDRELVKDFAELLLTRKAQARADARGPVYVDVDAIAGMFKGMGGDKSSVELVHEAMDEWAEKLGRGEP